MIAGIVCEYNPFHNGHLYHISETKKQADYVVCAMSGNFVQRGECAFTDKWTRARMAIECGADIVIDLPLPWCCASAQDFSLGAISLLTAFGIDTLSFGSETDDLPSLIRAADFTSGQKASSEIRKYVSEGMSYPLAISKAAKGYLPEDTVSALLLPNSTLAVEYIKASKLLGCEIDFMPIKRIGTNHDSNYISCNFASASKIRELGICDEIRSLMPENSFSLLKEQSENGFAPCLIKRNERAVLSHLRGIPQKDYALYISDESGICSRLFESVKIATTLDELYSGAKSKNYTHARIRREVLSLYLGIEKESIKKLPPYIRILAVSKKGLSLLSQIKEKATLPIITKHSEFSALGESAKTIYTLQCSSTDKFALMSEKIRPCGLEQKNSIIIQGR